MIQSIDRVWFSRMLLPFCCSSAPGNFFFIDFGIFHFSVFLQHVLARVPDDLQTSVVNPMLSSHVTDIHNHTRFVLYFYST